MKNLKLLTLPLMVLIATIIVACANTSSKEKVVTKPKKKEATTMAFPKHPGTIKMVKMLDKSVKIISIDKIPESSQFVYYTSENIITDIKNEAVKAIPIVEERLYPNGKDNKLVPVKEADYIWIEMYGPKGKLLKTHTLWRGGVRGGQRAKTQ